MKRKATEATVRAFCEAVYPQYTDLAMTMNGEEEMLQEATKLIRSRDALLSLLREARDILDRYRTGRLPSYAEPPTWKLTDDLLSRLDSALKEAEK